MSTREHQLLQRAIELNRSGVWEIDAAARTTFVSEPVAALLGYEAPDIVGHPPFAFMDAIAAAATHASLERRRAGRREVREVSLCHREGHRVPVLVAAAPLLAPDGGYEGSSAVIVDLRERNGSQSRREDLVPAEIADIADGGTIGTWALDTGTDRLQWSSEMFTIFGVDPAGFRPSYAAVIDRVHPADRARVARTRETALVDGKAYSIYFRIVRPDGATRLVHARGSLGPGERAVIAGTLHDVTDRLSTDRAVSPREREVLDLMAEGLTTEEIANRLQIAVVTVRSHVQNAIDKLGAHNRVHAVVLALRAGEIDL